MFWSWVLVSGFLLHGAFTLTAGMPLRSAWRFPSLGLRPSNPHRSIQTHLARARLCPECMGIPAKASPRSAVSGYSPEASASSVGTSHRRNGQCKCCVPRRPHRPPLSTWDLPCPSRGGVYLSTAAGDGTARSQHGSLRGQSSGSCPESMKEALVKEVCMLSCHVTFCLE